MNASIALPLETPIPQLAPLPVPVMLHLAAHQKRGPQKRFALTFSDELDRESRNFHAIWTRMEEAVREKRALAYTLLSEVIETDDYSTQWVQQTLADYHRAVTPPTISRWRDHGLLRYDEWNRPNADSVASLFIVSLIDSRERRRMPSTMPKSEPFWWCWRQDSPHSPTVPCPIPLPDDLPPSSLLWTPWAGAAWHPSWLNVGQRGAIRWAGTRVQFGKPLWNITEDDLRRWDPGVDEFPLGVLEMAPEILHTKANLVLLRLAQSRLPSLVSGAAVSLP
jgi:hypothetical protein